MGSWDHNRALAAVGGDDRFLDELAGIFCAASPTLLKNLGESIAAKSAARAADAAHLLGCAARSLAAPEAAVAAFTLEGMALRNEFDPIKDAFYTLLQEVEFLEDELRKFRSER